MTTTASDAGAVLLPDLGEDIEEADVLQIYVSIGDAIELEQPIVEIETEKATLDLPSSVAGTVTQIHVRQGDTIRPGDPVLSVESAAVVSESITPVQEEPTAEPAPTPTEPTMLEDVPEVPAPTQVEVVSETPVGDHPAPILKVPPPAPPPLGRGRPRIAPRLCIPIRATLRPRDRDRHQNSLR